MFFGTINTAAAVTSTFQEKDSFVNSVITTVLEHNIYTTESIIYTMKHNENEIHENFRKKMVMPFALHVLHISNVFI